jgi:hypothetical protein
MPRPAVDGRNPTKTREQADRSKKNVALNKVEQKQELWRKERQKRAAKVDKMLDGAARLAKQIAAAEKKREDTRKALEDLGDMILGALKELKTMQEAPVKDHLPKPPVNTAGLSVLLPILIAMTVWWKGVKKLK